MMHIEVVTEARVVRMVQGSMAVDLEAGRSKVSRLLDINQKGNSNTGCHFLVYLERASASIGYTEL